MMTSGWKRSAAGILTAMVVLATGINAEEPELRVGIFTDTHIQETEQSCQLVRKAFELFKKHKVDMVVHLGDLADRHYPEGYKIYRRYFDEVFGDRKPRQIYIFASHDRIGIKTKAGFDSDMQKFKNALNIQHKICDKLVVKGYPFLIYPDFPDDPLEKKMTDDIREMVKTHPGKPVFVLDHVPPCDTTENSRILSSSFRRKVFDQFPQVIHFSGHTHNSLRNERCIWQGNFTEVNAGCLSSWTGTLVGNGPLPRKKSDGVIVMEVFPREILLRRYSVSDGSEIRPETPWCIALPFDPQNAPYNPAVRKAHSTAPKFPAGSKIAVKAAGNPFHEIKISFPEALHPEGCYHYNILLEKKMPSGDYETITQKEEFGQFYFRENQRKSINRTGFNAGFFVPNEYYRITIIPQNFYGSSGTPLRQEFKTGIPECGKIVFESDNPVKSCIFRTGISGGRVLESHDGFFQYRGNNTRLVFPEGIWNGPKGTRFRIVINMNLEQPQNSNWNLVLWSTAGRGITRIVTPSGKVSNFLASIDFKKKNNDDSYFLLLQGRYPGKVAFRSVRIEKFEEGK